jgi:hypothetical protein
MRIIPSKRTVRSFNVPVSSDVPTGNVVPPLHPYIKETLKGMRPAKGFRYALIKNIMQIILVTTDSGHKKRNLNFPRYFLFQYPTSCLKPYSKLFLIW